MNLSPAKLHTALALWFLLVVIWPKSSNNLHPEEARESSHEGLYKSQITNANFGLLGVHFFESQNNQRKWNIEAKFGELHRKENYAYLQDVTTYFYSDKTNNKITTKSDYGRSWTNKSLVELEGNVTVRSQKGYLFSMDKLNYDGNVKEFTSEDVVTMRGPDELHPTMQLKGTGLLANLEREHFIIKKSVSAIKKLKNGKNMRIISKTGEFFTNENRAVFINKVHSEMPDATIIDSDVFEMLTDGSNEKLEARGNVKFDSKERYGKAENLYLEVGGTEIILDGRAEIISKENKSRLAGRRIRLYTEDDRVEVEEAEGSSEK